MSKYIFKNVLFRVLFFVILSLIVVGCGKTKEKLIVEKADINNPKISWEACRVSEFECGHLIVPRDYSNNDGIVYSIALMKLPAKIKRKKRALFSSILEAWLIRGKTRSELCLRNGEYPTTDKR